MASDLYNGQKPLKCFGCGTEDDAPSAPGDGCLCGSKFMDNLSMGFYSVTTSCPLHHGGPTIAHRVSSNGDDSDLGSGVWLVPGVKGPVFDDEPVILEILSRIELNNQPA